MVVQEIKRVFVHGTVRLNDPDPLMTPVEVLNFYSPNYPELATAVIESTNEIGDGAIVEYIVKKEFKTKG